MSWTVDVPVNASGRPSQLPSALAAAVAEVVAYPASQQPAWPDPDQAARVLNVLETVPSIAVPTEIDVLQGRLGAVAWGEAFLLQANCSWIGHSSILARSPNIAAPPALSTFS